MAAPIRRGTLIFGLLGGAVAWLLHLLLAYLIAEFGCLLGYGEVMWGGVSLVAWTLLVMSALILALAGVATAVSYIKWEELGLGSAGEGTEKRSAQLFLARTALITNFLFLLIILAQTVPIFYYLREC